MSVEDLYIYLWMYIFTYKYRYMIKLCFFPVDFLQCAMPPTDLWGTTSTGNLMVLAMVLSPVSCQLACGGHVGTGKLGQETMFSKCVCGLKMWQCFQSSIQRYHVRSQNFYAPQHAYMLHMAKMIHVPRARGGNLIGVFCTQLPPETWAWRVNCGESRQST